MHASSFTARYAIAALVLALALASCGAEESVATDPGREATTTTTPSDEESETPEPTVTGAPAYDPAASAPPVVEVRRGDSMLELDAWAYCWTPPAGEDGICADGAPPAEPELLAGQGPITVTFPADFAFSAWGYSEDYTNELGFILMKQSGDSWELDTDLGEAAIIEVFGNGPEGDVIVSFALSGSRG